MYDTGILDGYGEGNCGLEINEFTGATSVPFAHSVPELTVDERDNSTIVQTARYIGYRWVSDEHRVCW